ncbi:hypothetical protein TCAL_15204 [Tigriopus californicus]|uniref:Uncharacterized protein n=1 Tax=Tigriopus californicus TaxID=6832 RepID=A0A553NE85_TIGCA|nr:hypothetical protein TCAL_15204 [Tigriopus californicus]
MKDRHFNSNVLEVYQKLDCHQQTVLEVSLEKFLVKCPPGFFSWSSSTSSSLSSSSSSFSSSYSSSLMQLTETKRCGSSSDDPSSPSPTRASNFRNLKPTMLPMCERTQGCWLAREYRVEPPHALYNQLSIFI